MKNQTGEASFRESSSFDWLIFLSFFVHVFDKSPYSSAH